MKTRKSNPLQVSLEVGSLAPDTLENPRALLDLFSTLLPQDIKRVIVTHFKPGSELYNKYKEKRFHKGDWVTCFALMNDDVMQLSLDSLVNARVEMINRYGINRNNNQYYSCNPVADALYNLMYIKCIQEINSNSPEKRLAKQIQALFAEKDPKQATHKPHEFNASELLSECFNNFQGINFNDQSLETYDFRTSLIHKATFIRSNLRGCNFASLDINDAFFHCSDLRDANLEGANLTNCWLLDANISGANTNGCQLPDIQAKDITFLLTESLFSMLNELPPSEIKNIVLTEFQPGGFKYNAYQRLSADEYCDPMVYACYALITEEIYDIDAKRLAMVIDELEKNHTSNNASIFYSLKTTLHILESCPSRFDAYLLDPPKFEKSQLNTNFYMNLRGTKLRKENLIGCDFRHALLQNTSFLDCNLSCANLRGLDLSETHFYRTAMDVADLRDCKFVNGRGLRYTSLICSDLSGANFEGATVSGCDMRGANLQGANCTNTKFEGNDSSHTDFREATLNHTSFDELHNHLDHYKLISANFSGCDMRTVTMADSCNDNLDGTDFSYCNFSNINELWLNANSASFKFANFANTQLYHGYLTDCDFSGANMFGVKARDNCFSNCNFTGARLREIAGSEAIRSSQLTEADITGAKLEVLFSYSGSKDSESTFFNSYTLLPCILENYLTNLEHMLKTLKYDKSTGHQVKIFANIPNKLAEELRHKASDMTPAQKKDVLNIAYNHTLFRGTRLVPSIPHGISDIKDKHGANIETIDRELIETEAQRILLK